MSRFLAFIVMAMAAFGAADTRPTLAIGSPAPGFSLPGIDGETQAIAEAFGAKATPVRLELVSAGELKKLRANPTGKVLLVYFWATWCGPCLAEFPDLQTTYRMFRGRDFELVTVAAHAPDGKALYQTQGEIKILELRRLILANLPDPDYIGQRAYWASR